MGRGFWLRFGLVFAFGGVSVVIWFCGLSEVVCFVKCVCFAVA